MREYFIDISIIYFINSFREVHKMGGKHFRHRNSRKDLQRQRVRKKRLKKVSERSDQQVGIKLNKIVAGLTYTFGTNRLRLNV